MLQIDDPTGLWVIANPANSTVQTITLSLGESDTFTLSYNGASTDPLSSNISATDLQIALNTLIGVGLCTVAGNGPYTVTFDGGDLAKTDVVPGLSATSTGGTVTITTVLASAGSRYHWRGI